MTREDQKTSSEAVELKEALLTGDLSERPERYSRLISEWERSVQLGVDVRCKVLMDQHRDMHVFERIDALQKCHIEYFNSYYQSRNAALDELGCAIFYLDTRLAAYHKAGNTRLLEELKGKGIRVGTQFSLKNVGVFVANMALQKPFENFCRIGPENYMELFDSYACLARYGAGNGTGFFSVNLIFAPLELYCPNLHKSLCFILEAEDVAYKNNFIYPHVERRIKLLERSAQFSNDIFLLVDDQGNVAFFNDLFHKEFHREESPGLGRMLKEFMPELEGALSCLKEGREVTTQEVLLTNRYKERHLYYVDCILIREEQRRIGWKISIKTTDQMKRYASRVNRQMAHFTFEDIKGRSPVLLLCKEIGQKAAESVSNVLITGESGTGKELFAQAIHNASSRKNGPFVSVNCGAIPKELIGSELFGYEEGAFTGARRGGHPGKFEQADKGTIFLDEIAEMPLDMQVYLLRALEGGDIARIGGKKYVPLDVRVIAATNKDLWSCVSAGTFRLDLYFRLNVLRLELPPLRERADDMEELINHFINDLSKKLGKEVRGVSAEVIRLFQRCSWPGNLRELRNTIERCVNVIPDGTQMLTVESLPFDLRQTMAGTPAELELVHGLQSGELGLERGQLPNYKDYTEGRIRLLMLRHNGNKSLVAKELGMSRSTLYKKLKELHYEL